MKEKMNFVKMLFVIVLLLAPTPVFAGAVQLPQTGQTKCYDSAGTEIACVGTGQDGEIQAGIASPNLRFTDNGDQTVTDNLTGLIWTKDGNLMKTRDPSFDADAGAGDGAVTWQHALDYIKKLNQENYLGYSDWRLPNRKELYSLVHAGQSNIADWLNTQVFSNVQPSSYYSSTVVAFLNGNTWAFTAWRVSFINGTVSYSPVLLLQQSFFVRAVRSGQYGSSGNSVISLPRTGQATCCNASEDIACAGTGSDGELQMGVPWPVERFSYNGDPADNDLKVTDNLTGLIWTLDANIMKTRDPSFDADLIIEDGAVTWQHALDYIKKLNQANYLGHDDWRLPNVIELESLVHSGYTYQSDTGTWLNVQSSGYWSSTSDASRTGSAWIVNFKDGQVSAVTKGAGFYVRAVRSGFGKLVISKSGPGTVTSAPAGIACGSQCRAYFNPGTSVTLTPQTTSDSTFAGWSGGGCTGTGTCVVTMDAAKSVSAIFNSNTPLAANAGLNQVVYDKANLDGSASQGNVISWNWTLTHQTNPAYSRTATGQKPNLDNLAAGFYDVLLTVSDGTTASTATNLLAVAGYWDVNGDGKLGLAEAIYILQTTVGVR